MLLMDFEAGEMPFFVLIHANAIKSSFDFGDGYVTFLALHTGSKWSQRTNAKGTNLKKEHACTAPTNTLQIKAALYVLPCMLSVQRGMWHHFFLFLGEI